MSQSHEIQILHALLERKIDGAVALVYENEKPLGSLGGVLDFVFRGSLSFAMGTAVTGKAGECTLIPGRTDAKNSEQGFPVLLLGCGPRTNATAPALSQETVKSLTTRLSKLGWKSVGLMKSEFGKTADEISAKSGVTLWTPKT